MIHQSAESEIQTYELPDGRKIPIDRDTELFGEVFFDDRVHYMFIS